MNIELPEKPEQKNIVLEATALDNSNNSNNSSNTISNMNDDSSINGWNPEQDYFLKKLIKALQGTEWKHNEAVMYYTKRDKYLTIVNAFISTLTGTSSFTTILNSDTIEKEIIFILQCITMFMIIINGILSVLQNFFKYSKLVEKHRFLAKESSKLLFIICNELNLRPDNRTNGHTFILDIKNRYLVFLDDDLEVPKNINDLYIKNLEECGIKNNDIHNPFINAKIDNSSMLYRTNYFILKNKH
jgi:hypothetical protein